MREIMIASILEVSDQKNTFFEKWSQSRTGVGHRSEKSVTTKIKKALRDNSYI